MRKTCSRRAPPFPHVLCSQSLFSMIPCPLGLTPPLSPVPPHTDPFGEACRGPACMVLLWPPTAPHGACIESSPHTTSCLQAWSRKEGACVPGAATGPVPAPGPSWSQCASRARFVYLCTTGSSGQAAPGSLHLGKERGSCQSDLLKCGSLRSWLSLCLQPLPGQ